MQTYFDTVKPPFFSVDFHYFRIPREKWELMLTRLAQMGSNMITVTVPWGFHEVNKGAVDLTGASNSRRDVAGLMELCIALNFYCILKPGPYSSNSGILGNGLPNWLSPDSNTFHANLPAATESWYKAISKILVDRQWPAGPIVALQINYESGQESVPAYSKQLTEVKWPIWLRKRYQGIEALNAAYGATYRTVSEVSFPQSWNQEPTPLEEDAKAFLAEVQDNTQGSYHQILVDAGWQIPIYPSAPDAHPQLPAMQTYSLTELHKPATLDPDNVIINLQRPIQVDPDPADIGDSPVWANDAPIRADASLRQKFWNVRQRLWLHTLPNANLDGNLLVVSFDTGGLATSGQDVALKISLAKGTKPAAYRLRFTGQLLADNNLKAARSKLSGPYQTEDDAAQIDLIFYLNNPTDPLSGFLLTYLRTLLTAQAQTLGRCATLAAALGQTLDPAQTAAKAPPASARPTPYTLTEARRGLSQADKILRKAMASIGGLEGGFDTMLGRSSAGIPEPAATSLTISPEIFEGSAREILIKTGEVCKAVIPDLKSTAEALQKTIDTPQAFTIEQYRQRYAQTVNTAQSARASLLEIIAQLRAEIASETLPLVAWRVHNQVQEIAESLRWGVLRG